MIKQLHVAGPTFAENGLFPLSDSWMRTNSRTNHEALDMLLSVPWKAFTNINNTTTLDGSIAQGSRRSSRT